MSEFTITLTRSQVQHIVELFDLKFFSLIADFAKDDAIDNMFYLIEMCDTYKLLYGLLEH